MTDNVMRKLLDLDPYQFEHFVADVWQERQGWITEVTAASRDRGVDVVGQPPGRQDSKTAVQCKRYSPDRKVTSREIQQYAALRQQYTDITGVTVVTTGGYTRDAKQLADRLDVHCIGGDELVRLIDRYDAHDILDWYVAGKPEAGVFR